MDDAWTGGHGRAEGLDGTEDGGRGAAIEAAAKVEGDVGPTPPPRGLGCAARPARLAAIAIRGGAASQCDGNTGEPFSFRCQRGASRGAFDGIPRTCNRVVRHSVARKAGGCQKNQDSATTLQEGQVSGCQFALSLLCENGCAPPGN
eukprot:2655005-Rhodomonas_salina.1